MASEGFLSTSADQADGKSQIPVSCGTSWVASKDGGVVKVLGASGFHNDFYANCLSWGYNTRVLGFRSCLLSLVNDDVQMCTSLGYFFDEFGALKADGEASSMSKDVVRNPDKAFSPTALSVLRSSDELIFSGTSNGCGCLVEIRPEGTFACRQVFDVRRSPLFDFFAAPHTHFKKSSRFRSSASLSLLSAVTEEYSSTVTSMCGSSTSSAMPHAVVTATATGELIVLDSRCQKPVMTLRNENGGNCDILEAVNNTIEGDGENLNESVSTIASALVSRERLCAVSWNASGSFVATGSGDGCVAVWSLGFPKRPLHRFQIDSGCAVKAVKFHPRDPYELAIGCSAGKTSVRVCALSSLRPRCVYAASSPLPVIQVDYSPDGSHLVTSHGSETAAESRKYTKSLAPLAAMDYGVLRGDEGDLFTSRKVRTPWNDEEEDWGSGRNLLLPNGECTQSLSPPPEPEELQESYCLTVWKKSKQLYSQSQEATTLPLKQQKVLYGHFDRVLCMTTPYLGSSHEGRVITLASGEDESLRTWKVFQPA